MAADTPAARKLREFLAAAAAHPVAQRGAEIKARLEERLKCCKFLFQRAFCVFHIAKENE